MQLDIKKLRYEITGSTTIYKTIIEKLKIAASCLSNLEGTERDRHQGGKGIGDS